MAECINDLAGDILQDCNTVYGVGVEKIAYLIKKSDRRRPTPNRRSPRSHSNPARGPIGSRFPPKRPTTG